MPKKLNKVIKNKISIIGGAGHIGLPLAVKFAEKNFKINIIDINKKNLLNISKNRPPFKEIFLKKRLGKVLKKNLIEFSSNLNSIKNSKYIIVCVGTPISDKLKPDLKLFYILFKKLSKYIDERNHLIIRSSILPGISSQVYEMIKSKCKNLTYCPERIVEGLSLKELPTIPQIIAGSNKKTIIETNKIFKKITKYVLFSNFIEAELSKIFSNTYRYINFAIPNEMYLISKKMNADFSRIRKIMRFKYPRNSGLAKAGFVGGPCLMKDSMQISYLFNQNKSLINSAYETNEKLPEKIVLDLKKDKNYKIKLVGVLGLAFKQNSDDVRGSLALKLIKILKKNKFKILFSDPFVKIKNKVDEKKLIQKSKIIIIGANHTKYKRLQIPKSKKLIDISGFLK
ncbi:nucleotide sugar dehydrogenase [Candidatus Pelagibacter sp.]|jgi:UDP-N-acetyl-D-mannosaminuronic acid dehydrogenase|nr:nucleotide sugar dehydrogenase [Candidatus Pelagibacter sp.]